MYVHKQHMLLYCCLLGVASECSRGFLTLILLMALLNRKQSKRVSPIQTDKMINIVKGNHFVKGQTDHHLAEISVTHFLMKQDS